MCAGDPHNVPLFDGFILTSQEINITLLQYAIKQVLGDARLPLHRQFNLARQNLL